MREDARRSARALRRKPGFPRLAESQGHTGPEKFETVGKNFQTIAEIFQIVREIFPAGLKNFETVPEKLQTVAENFQTVGKNIQTLLKKIQTGLEKFETVRKKNATVLQDFDGRRILHAVRPSNEQMLRSLVRILVASVLAVLALFAIAAMIIRQPSFAHVTFDGPRAEAAALQRHVAFLTAAHLEGSDPAPYIAEAFRAAGAEVSEQFFEARGRIYRNVVALFPGQRGWLVVVGAHYDAFAVRQNLPGADDNASGTAGLLELARLIGARRPTMPVELVAFANEEPPFFGSEQMGSAVHAASLVRDCRPPAAMICLEMIGYFSKRQRWNSWLMSLIYPHKGDFIGVAGGWEDRVLARNLKAALNGAGIQAVSFTGPRDMLDASDQRNYWAHDFRAVMITDTAYLRNPNYHTARDTADTLDYARMARVVDGIASALRLEQVAR